LVEALQKQLEVQLQRIADLQVQIDRSSAGQTKTVR
jgi:hypothetical protein